jgi:hypothetical protein
MRNPRFTLTAALLSGADPDLIDELALWVSLGYCFAALTLLAVTGTEVAL